MTAPARVRLGSVDLLRGAAMILMAIDHVRVYSGLPAGGPTPGIFFTRWVTHFCAPIFVFLAGTSIALRGENAPGTSRLLLSRGAWLVLLELTVLRLAWTFNTDFRHYELAGVIWMLGWCMILMAGLVRLPRPWLLGFGVLVVAGHNVLDNHFGALTTSLAEGPLSGLWKVLYLGFFRGPVSFGPDGPNLMVLFSIVPWIGVMALGHVFGAVLRLPAADRDRWCLRLGLGAIAAFLVLRGFNLYGDPRPWGAAPAPGGPPPYPPLLGFLNTSKYPASLLFLLMTLGPAVALIPALERARGWLAAAVATFGRVPFFYYLLHIPLIHALALVVSIIRTGGVDPWLLANHPMGNPPAPEGYAWSLGLLYLVWAVALLVLYPLCRWFAGLKARRRDWWLSYL